MSAGFDVDRYEWLKAINSEHGPKSYTERCLLAVIYTYTSSKQRYAYPGQKCMSKRVHLSDRQVKRLLKKLDSQGWIRRVPRGRHTVYWPTVPAALFTLVDPPKYLTFRSWIGDTKMSPIANANVAVNDDTQMSPVAAPHGPQQVTFPTSIRDISNGTGDISGHQKVTPRCHPNPSESTILNTPSESSARTRETSDVLKKRGAATGNLKGQARIDAATRLAAVAGIDAAVRQYTLTPEETAALEQSAATTAATPASSPTLPSTLA